jgi:hypothetical protein
MLYELRVYKAMPGRLPILLKRFESTVLPLWKKHGIQPAGFWTTLIGEAANVSLHYMITWNSLAEREQKWGAFVADPDWIKARDESEADGAYVAELASSILAPTSFSALK